MFAQNAHKETMKEESKIVNKHTIELLRVVDNAYTPDELRSQDGKEYPLRLNLEGPVIGKAVMRYDEATMTLNAEFEVSDPKIVKYLNQNASSVYGYSAPEIKKESNNGS